MSQHPSEPSSRLIHPPPLNQGVNEQSFAPRLSSRLLRSTPDDDPARQMEIIKSERERSGLPVFEMHSSLITQSLRPSDNRRRGGCAEAHPPTHHGPALGDLELRMQIARTVQSRFAERITYENIAVTGGARQALQTLMIAAVNPGEEVIVLPPCYPRYKEIIFGNNAVPREVPLKRSDNYQPDMKAVTKAWGQNTKAILATTPNNPTGTVITGENISALLEIATWRSGILILDETFEAFDFHTEPRNSNRLRLSNSVVIGSFSETYSIPDLRAGYVVAAPEIIKRVEQWERCCPSAPSTFVQKLALQFMENRQAHLSKVLPKIRERQLTLKSALINNPNIGAVWGDGGTFVWVMPRNQELVDCRKTAELLAKRSGVLVMPGEDYNSPGCFRIGVGQITSDSAFRTACQILSQFKDFVRKANSPCPNGRVIIRFEGQFD
jgi:aspartate/methionine/tyrosine aminotransferase